MKTTAGWLYALAALVGIASLVIGGVLIAHSMQTCDTQFFCTSEHPFVGAGAGIVVGGLINAAVLGVVAHLCEVVADLRDYRDADAAVVIEQAADVEQPLNAGPVPQAPPWGLYGNKA